MSLKTLIREGWEAEGRVLFADDTPMPTREALLGCYEPPIPREPGRLKHVPDIGQRSDAEIARRECCPYHVVRAERMRRGLPRWRRSQP